MSFVLLTRMSLPLWSPFGDDMRRTLYLQTNHGARSPEYNPLMPKIKQANSRHCFICGVENPIGLRLSFYEVAEGVVETEYLAPEHFQGYPNVLHGGIVAAILDEITGRAHMGNDVHNPRFMFTGKLEVKYRKNVPIGRRLKFVGKATKNKSRAVEAWAGVYDAETNELLAEGTGLHIDVPKDKLDVTQTRLEELGWKVYPDE